MPDNAVVMPAMLYDLAVLYGLAVVIALRPRESGEFEGSCEQEQQGEAKSHN
jgi:hypothetical protein